MCTEEYIMAVGIFLHILFRSGLELSEIQVNPAIEEDVKLSPSVSSQLPTPASPHAPDQECEVFILVDDQRYNAGDPEFDVTTV